MLDTDGDFRKMIPLYLEAGVNAFYPFEVQSDVDVLALRRQYPRAFAAIGGLDKRALPRGEAAIAREVDGKVPPMLESGGYVPMLDHSVPFDVPLRLFRYFVERVRGVAASSPVKLRPIGLLIIDVPGKKAMVISPVIRKHLFQSPPVAASSCKSAAVEIRYGLFASPVPPL